jgi:N-acetylmuramoyl-L-alanine amidase
MKNRALKRLICGLSILMALIPFFSFALPSPLKKDTVTSTGYKLKTIIVDPGHGGEHSGAGHFSPGARGSYSLERNVTLAIAFKLQKAIEKDMSGVKVVMTRTTEDREVVGHKHHKPVYRTVEVPDRSGKGVLVLVYGFHRTKEEEKAIKENLIEDDPEMNTNPDPNDPGSLILMNEYKRKYRKQSIHFAELINNEFVQTDGRHSEGIREQGLLVLCHSAMPAVLIETGYINNPDDEAYLNSEDGQNEIVASIVRALQNYKNEVESVSP